MAGRHVLAAVALAGVVVLMAGCGSAGTASSAGAGGNGGTGARPGAVTQSGEAAAVASLGETPNSLVLPLTAYYPSDQQLQSFSAVNHQLVSRCMQRSGFSFQFPAGGGITLGLDPGRGNSYDFGITSMSLAERYGYHAIQVRRGNQILRPNTVKRPVLPAAERSAEKACDIQVDGKVGWARWDSGSLVLSLGMGAWQRANAEPGMLVAFKSWSACMAAKGFDYATPMNAEIHQVGNSAKSLGWTTTAPTGLEIQTATADVACKQQTGLLAAWIKALTAQQNALLEPNLPRLRAEMASFQSVYGAEQRLLAADQ